MLWWHAGHVTHVVGLTTEDSTAEVSYLLANICPRLPEGSFVPTFLKKGFT